MADIKVSVEINKEPEKVFDFIRYNLEKFPEFMKDVKRLETVDKLDGRLITAWWVDVDGVIVKWKEEDIFDRKKLALDVLDSMEGVYAENLQSVFTRMTGLYTHI